MQLKYLTAYIPEAELIPIIDKSDVGKYYDLQRLKTNYKSYSSPAAAELEVIRINGTHFIIDEVEKYVALRNNGGAFKCKVYDFWENRKQYTDEVPNFINDISTNYSITQIYKYFSQANNWSVTQWAMYLQISVSQLYKIRLLSNLNADTLLWFYDEQMIMDFALDVAKVVPEAIQPRINDLIRNNKISIFEYFQEYNKIVAIKSEEE
jgi:hypothetical protein